MGELICLSVGFHSLENGEIMSLSVFSKYVDSWGIGKQAILIDHLSHTQFVLKITQQYKHTQFGSTVC